MEQQGFDVESWLGQAKQGRAQLVEKKRELMQQRNALEDQIAKVDADIAKIDEVAGPAIGGNGSGRMTGVQDLVRTTVRELSMPDSDHPEHNASRLWDEDDLVTEVLRREPMMKKSSVRSALRTLVSKGEIERQGKRGAHTYRWASPDAEQPSVEDRVRNALANAGKGGVSEKDLAWKGGDGETTGTLLDTLIKEGVVERFPIGEGEFRFRIVPKPGDLEEQKTLFAGADAPPG